MNIRRIVWTCSSMWALTIASAARAQLVHLPQSSAAGDIPIVTRALNESPVFASPAPNDAATASEAQTSADPPRSIAVETSPVTNRTGQFQFHDVTDRSQAQEPARSLDERRTAVEAYRQSLVGTIRSPR